MARKKYTLDLSQEDSDKLEALLAKKGKTFSHLCRELFRLSPAVELPWLRKAKVCQPGVPVPDTQPILEQERDIAGD